MKKLTAEWCKCHIDSMKSNGMSLLEEKYLQALEIALPILEQQERGEGEWIDWGGGKCPVDDNANVEVKFRDGCFGGGIRKAGGYYWGRSNAAYDSDIIAYRITPERTAHQKESTPSNSKASVGLPKLIKTPGLEVSTESLDSLIEKGEQRYEL